MRYIVNHWRGRHSVVWAFGVNLIALRIVIWGLFSRFVPSAPSWLWGLIALDLLILIWQLVGTFRSLEQNDFGLSTEFWRWSAYVGMICIVFIAGARALDRVADQYELAHDESLIPKTYTLTRQGDVLFVEGEITYAMGQAVEKALSDDPSARAVNLESDGGQVQAARALAKTVEAYGLATMVDKVCRSACTLVFAAGAERKLADGATLGFHGYEQRGYVKLLDVRAEMAKDRDYLIARGITPQFAAEAFDVPPSRMWHPTRAVLERAKVITK
jgi:hypothetical protein